MENESVTPAEPASAPALAVAKKKRVSSRKPKVLTFKAFCEGMAKIHAARARELKKSPKPNEEALHEALVYASNWKKHAQSEDAEAMVLVRPGVWAKV